MVSAYAQSWTLTFVLASLAAASATVGLALVSLYPDQAPLVALGLLVASLACTALAFARLALRVRQLELENEGLVEEISQEFDRVKDKLEIFGEAVLTPDEAAQEDPPLRRVAVK